MKTLIQITIILASATIALSLVGFMWFVVMPSISVAMPHNIGGFVVWVVCFIAIGVFWGTCVPFSIMLLGCCMAKYLREQND